MKTEGCVSEEMLLALLVGMILAVAPSLVLNGDDNPPAYPTFHVHVEEPPMKDHNKHEEIFELAQLAYAWRRDAIFNFTSVCPQIEEIYGYVRKFKKIRQISRSSSFLESLPEIINAVKNNFAGGFEKFAQSEPNYGPFPVVNVFAEPPDRRGDDVSDFDQRPQVEDILYRENSTLARIYKEMQQNIDRKMIEFSGLNFTSTPISFLELQPNYVEPNPAPFQEISFFMNAQPTTDGRAIPDADLTTNPATLAHAAKRKLVHARLKLLAKEMDILTQMLFK